MNYNLYALQQLPPEERGCISIFLAGPTPRSPDIKSWRPEALSILRNLGFTGTICIPETEDGVWNADKYEEQIEWELQNLYNSFRLFWIPRNMDNMPGMTTNVEFGLFHSYHTPYSHREMACLGYPKDVPHIKYLDYLARKSKLRISHTLEETCQNILLVIKDLFQDMDEDPKELEKFDPYQVLYNPYDPLANFNDDIDPKIFASKIKSQHDS